ncbi:hypothetical protein DOTSEDRAFT_27443 [Dothistroma septosporum NZE10]|uniref:Uncharacterized protein n=1 Tax=Dothistroma septosporum (strain NZE10 / CBS 128990) TaxID=675120 RepID=N1PH20_DOTSN|nr:hypothetical protein DOTSEDRAFT_27443 [Dothistroma septosporum NZE10]
MSRTKDVPIETAQGLRKAVAATQDLPALVGSMELSQGVDGVESRFEGDDELPCSGSPELVRAATQDPMELMRGMVLSQKKDNNQMGDGGDDREQHARPNHTVPSLPARQRPHGWQSTARPDEPTGHSAMLDNIAPPPQPGTQANAKQRRCYFLQLLGELRNEIYRLALLANDPVPIPGLTPQERLQQRLRDGPDSRSNMLANLQSRQIPEPVVLRCCHTIREEATGIYHGEIVFKVQFGYDKFGTHED